MANTNYSRASKMAEPEQSKGGIMGGISGIASGVVNSMPNITGSYPQHPANDEPELKPVQPILNDMPGDQTNIKDNVTQIAAEGINRLN